MRKKLFMKSAVMLTAVLLAATFLPLNVSGSNSYDPVSKEETVYAVLGADGSFLPL
jgi:hypothetical protein